MQVKTNKSTIFYIVRHAESEHNVKEIVGSNPHITSRGQEQAVILEKKFNDIDFDYVYTSNLFRTKETARIIVKNKKVKIMSTKQINERDYGKFDGIPISEFNTKLKGVFKKMDIMSDEEIYKFRRYEGCETDDEMVTRFKKFLTRINRVHSGKTILVVTHGILMRVFLIRVKHMTYKELPLYGVKNTAFIKLYLDNNNYKIQHIEGINTK